MAIVIVVPSYSRSKLLSSNKPKCATAASVSKYVLSSDYTRCCRIPHTLLRQGGMMWTEPATDDYFVVEKGKDSLKDYTFGQRIMTHKVRTLICPSHFGDWKP